MFEGSYENDENVLIKFSSFHPVFDKNIKWDLGQNYRKEMSKLKRIILYNF